MPYLEFSYLSDDDYSKLRAEIGSLPRGEELIVNPPADADMLFADRLAYRINEDKSISQVRARANNAQMTQLFEPTKPGRVIITREES